MTGSVGAYVVQVDRVLGAGQALFATSGRVAVSGGGDPAVPAAPPHSGLARGVTGAATDYVRGWSTAGAVTGELHAAAADGYIETDRGRAGAGAVRDTARAQAAAIAPAAGSSAGIKLLVSAMDERLAAMQRQIDATRAQNRVLAARLRQVAMAYHLARLGGGGPFPGVRMAGVSGGGPAGLGGPAMRTLNGLSGAPPAAMSTLTSGGAPAPPAGGPAGPDGVAQAAIALSQVSFHGKSVWPGGKLAIRGYLEEALDRMGIVDPRARANWIPGMMTIADHESTYRTNAINLSDDNAWGAAQLDGGPLHATRGPWQVMPDTFARYHQPGTSNSVWDPVAAACASMNYQMDRYGVALDGHNQRALVGQANPGIRRGY